ncbi:Uncharacterised protein [Mycobacteroides abscessus subsp. abscessus]|nr:Uncharacterised protein [Mycobacteroides abscessus subsp. abscessus]
MATAFAIACNTLVLPALGGLTMRARWPLPMGITRSMTRVVRMCCSVSRRRRWFGYSGVSLLNSGRFFAASTSPPLTVSMRTSGLNF